MIRNNTARNLMYSWHNGMSSAFYSAASSGLVRDWGALLAECESIKGDQDNPQDYAKLLPWIEHQQRKAPRVEVQGSTFYELPWR
jgi:hypothetical protein